MGSKYTPTYKRKVETARTPPKPLTRTALSQQKSFDSNVDLDTAFSVYSPAPTVKTPKYLALSRRSKSVIDWTPSRSASKTSHREPETPECYAPVSMETPRRLAKSSSNLAEILDEYRSDKDEEISNLKVAVRVRPMSLRECSYPSIKQCLKVKENELTILNGPSADGLSGKSFTFQYDHVFWSCNVDDPDCADQKIVYETLAKPLVDSAFEGYNICLFAYGQTGSGKSYSMMGNDSDDPEKLGCEAGIIPRMCEDIFKRIEVLKPSITVEVEVSYFEIYNEKIHDLLTLSSEDGFINTADSNTKKPPLKVREHPESGPYVVDLSTHSVDSYRLLRNWLVVGAAQRATAATGMNDKSSRSHAIFNIVLNLTENTASDDGKDLKLTKRSKISLVDLAGSERVSHTKVTSERLKEGVSINKSLLTLGKVITALADSKTKTTFVPYRESVLTWLLRENLGGNSRTVMLATISPASNQMEETLSTLRYACQARTIVNRVKVNEDVHARVIRELKAEVDRLKTLSQTYEREKRTSGGASSLPRKIIIETAEKGATEVENLKQKLSETEKKLKDWEEKLRQVEETRRIEKRLLKKNGLALELGGEGTHALLLNMASNADKVLFYLLPSGTTKIGRSSSLSEPDIVLDGPQIGNEHCAIINRGSTIYLIPTDHTTLVNGKPVKERVRLCHHDRIILGTSHFFRLINPQCHYKNTSEAGDYQQAYDEVLKEQEKRIRDELNIEQRAAIRKLELESTKKLSECHMKMNQLEKDLRILKREKEIWQNKQSDESENEQGLELDHLRRKLQPYDTTLLADLKAVLRETDHIELSHATEKVTAANAWSCTNNRKLDFKLVSRKDDLGLLTIEVEITDVEKNRSTIWPLQRLEIWLDAVKYSSNDCFELFETEWRDSDGEIVQTSAPSTPRKALNMLTEIGKSLARSPIHKLRTALQGGEPKSRRSLLTDNKENLLNSLMENSFEAEAKQCLIDMQTAAIRLQKLCKKCKRYSTDASLIVINDTENGSRGQPKVSEKVRSEFERDTEQIEGIIQELNYLLSESQPNSNESSPMAVKFTLE